jgi:NAD(P)-dependent dehydrogenase (short-subunit alcohol dehydrogenase family)
MLKDFAAKVAVITGAASGFGRAFADHGAALGMKLVLADVDEAALVRAVAELRAAGAEAIGVRTDVSRGEQVEALAQAALDAFGRVQLLFNNAGVGVLGNLWEGSANDWSWVFGVNVMGVAHGVRVFTPIMLRQDEPAHIVNTASVSGLLSPPAMGIYNASKHAVVSLTETLYHDLRHSGAPVGCSLLCPAYVPTGIGQSERARPAELHNEVPPSASRLAADQQLRRAVQSGKKSAADIAKFTFDAVREGRFYVITHPSILETVKLRHTDIEEGRVPTDPMSLRRAAKRGA